MGQHAEDWRTLHNFMAKYSGLFAGIEEIAAKADSLDDACTAHAQELTVLEEQIAAAKVTLATTGQRLADADAEVAKHHADLLRAGDQARQEVAHAHETAHAADVAKRQAEIDGLSAQRDGLSATVTALADALRDTEATLKQKQALLAEVERRLEAVRNLAK